MVLVDKIVEVVTGWWRRYVEQPAKDVYRGIGNLRSYYSVIYTHRWWDYYFMLEVMDKMLEEREQCWVKKTHYVGDTFTLGRIKVLRRMYREYKTSDLLDEDELLRRYLSRFARVVPRLWD
ncbi:MAG: hypothetical protein EOM36_04095 [Bacteroidia bacterium]|nr:hypothetical protein [Bacteroidia bacterium]